MEIKRYSSVHAIDPEHWDSILDDGDVFHEWQFMRIVEDGKVENSRFRYLLFYQDDMLVASTVLSAFTISLDMFIADAAWVRKLKKWSPAFFNIKILICGLPASFGQLNLKVVDERHADEVCSLIAAEMKAAAKEWNISFLAVKEFLASNVALGAQFLKEGFFRASSIPYMSVDICWTSFADYLASLRHPYRRHVLRSLRKIHCTAPVLAHETDYDERAAGIAWVVSRPSWIAPEQYHHLYLQVMRRTRTKLETLSIGFFEELFKGGQDYVLLSLVDEGSVLSAAILVPHGDTLTFMLVGRENVKDPYDSYFNLVSGIIAYAIAHKFKKLKMGQTAYWVKQSVGATAEDQHLYFACLGKIRHILFKRLNKLIFPEIKIRSVRVFNDSTHVHASVSE